MRIQFTERICSNIKLDVHVAHIDLGASMIRQLSRIRSQPSSNYFSWFAKFRQTSNRDLSKGNVSALDLAFDSKSLRTICENEDEAIREYGQTVTETLKHRLADLMAAMSVNDLLVGHPRVLEGGKDDQNMLIELGNDYQIILCANHPDNPVTENKKIDWSKVSRVKILRIERNYV